MAEELVFGLRYDGQGQIADLVNDLGRVERGVEQLRNVRPQQGTEQILKSLSSGLRQQFSDLDAARVALDRANAKAEDVARRRAVPATVGEKPYSPEAVKAGGFSSAAAEIDADRAAFIGQNRASKAVEREYQKYVGVLEESQRSQQAVANVGRIVARNLSEQAVAGSQAAAGTLDTAGLQKRLDAAIRARTTANEAEAKAAAEQAALTSRLASVDAELAARNPAPYASPDTTTHLGAAQERVNRATVEQELAQRRLIDAENSSTKTFESVTRAQQSVRGSAQSLARAQDELRLLETRQAGGFTDQFKTGFRGTNADRPYAEQIGQAFKFSVLYGTAYKVLFGITQTLQDALNEGIAFQQSMTELSIASGESVDELENLRKNLGDAATTAGAAPSQGVLVGARSLGLFGQAAGSGATQAEQARTATLSAQVVSRAAFGSGMQPEEIQRNLAAIAQAFQQGPAGQVRAYDLDAFLSRKFGVAPGGTYQSVSESATVGKAAGFNQEQVTAIAALLQARTGQTDAAVAGFMAQIFSRAGEGALVGVDQKYGVDATQDLAHQIAALADIYKRNPQARDDISAVFGRGKVQNAAIALLQGYPAVSQAATEAQTGALGAGDKAFNLRLSNVGGQLAQLGGDLKALESEIGRSGLLTVVGLAVRVLDELAKAGTDFLQAWNTLPGVVRSVVPPLALLAVVASRLATAQAAAAVATEAAAVRNGESLVVGGASGLAGGAAEKEAGGLLTKLRGAAIIAGYIAAIDVTGRTFKANSQLDAAESGTRAALSAGLGPGADAGELRSRAAELQLDADEAHKAAHGFFANVIEFGNRLVGDQSAAQRATSVADAASKEAKRLQDLAAYQEANGPRLPTAPLITAFDSDSLTASMQAITDNGGNAKDRLDALAATLNSTGDAATRARNAFDPKLFAGENAASFQRAIQGTGSVGQAIGNGRQLTGDQIAAAVNALPAGGGARVGNIAGGPAAVQYKNVLPGAVQDVLSPSDVASRLQKALESRGVNSLQDINAKVAGEISGEVIGNTPEEALKALGITDPDQIAKLRNMEVNALKKALLHQARVVHDIIRGNTTSLTPTDATAAAAQITSSTEERLSGLQASDSAGRVATLQRQIRLLRSTIRQTAGPVPSQVEDDLDSARRALAEQQIADLENLRRAAQQNATSKKQVASIGRSFLTREISKAVRAGDQDALVQIIGVAGKYGVAIARKAIQDAIQVARAALSIEAQMAQFAAAETAGLRGFIRQAAGPDASPAGKRLKALQNMLASLTANPHGNKETDNYLTGGDANLPGSLSGDGTDPAAADAGPTRAQIAAARQSAYAAGSESQINQARAAVATARADMAAAKKGTTEYYSALGAYLQARNELTDAIQAYHQNLYLLSHDATDPVVQAQAEARAAAAALRADKGKPADVRAADRVAVQSSQAALEAARFQKRLDAAQTAEQLGQISFRAYLNYLDHEHDRLERIKHRSYQQQQELNQVDQLLQEAAQSMQGIWNFGDINLPKPYQVRRYIEDNYGAQGGVGQAGGDIHQTATVYINGADTRMVIKVVKDVLGSNVDLETTKPRKR